MDVRMVHNDVESWLEMKGKITHHHLPTKSKTKIVNTTKNLRHD